ncbi:MAG: thaumatin family protein [Pseudomonadota bacterium]
MNLTLLNLNQDMENRGRTRWLSQGPWIQAGLALLALAMFVLSDAGNPLTAAEPACTPAQCASVNCGTAAPYACTAGSAKGGCSASAAHWPSVPAACSASCDASECSAHLPVNKVCTQAQCAELQTRKKYCKAWGADATPYACANNSANAFGGCSASATHWQPANCGGQAGCDARVCNWNMVVPQTSAAITTANRTLTFDNQCPFNIQVGYAGGAATDTSGDAIDCTSNASLCPAGSQCLTSGKNAKQCYWTMPSSFETARNLKSKTKSSVTLTNAAAMAKNNTQVKWSGNVWAHSRCDANFENCATAICPEGGCAPNTGPIGPVTLAEFTLQNNAQDYYDVSAINGVNVPISMAPTIGTGESSVYPPAGVEKDYWCGIPGNSAAAGGLLAADWNVGKTASTSQLPWLRYIDPTGFGQTCTKADDAACTGGSVCGLSFTKVGKKWETKQQCGKLVGWWTADEICGVNKDGITFDGIDCHKALAVPATYPAGSYADNPRQMDALLCQKNPAAGKETKGTFNNSCYTKGAKDSACCGCQDWSGVPSTQSCGGIVNASWKQYALPWLKPLKTAVPTAYSYPFDDKTSTFTCYIEAKDKITVPTPQQANEADYTITFCPGGLNVQAMQ